MNDPQNYRTFLDCYKICFVLGTDRFDGTYKELEKHCIKNCKKLCNITTYDKE